MSAFPKRCLRCLCSLLVLLSGRRAMAEQWDGVIEPRWLTLDFYQASAGLEAEGLSEKISSSRSGDSKHEYMEITPLLGLKLNGSIYHPNLVTFSFDGEGGLGWDKDVVKNPGSTETRNESQDFIRYVAQVDFLSGKPYNATFFAAQDHTYRNYDFFNTAQVDSLRYGGRLGWNVGKLSLSAETGYREERATGLGGTSNTGETYFNFNGLHERDRGTTSLTYNFSDFTDLNGATTSYGRSHAVFASDTETFGDRRQINATTGVSFNRFDYNGPTTDTYHASENVNVNHTDTLDSFYNLSLDDTEQSPTSSLMLNGTAGVRHRLYDSLTSTFDVHGVYDDLSSATGSGSNDRYGLSLREDYTKHLGGWGRLSLGGAVVGDHEDHDSSGSILSVVEEAHVLMAPTDANFRATILNNPAIILSTIVVRAPNGQVALDGIDYLVLPHGQLTEIQLVPTSLLLHGGSRVTVSYESRSLYTSSFESLNTSASIRLDLFDTVGLYGRGNWANNNASPEAMVETLTDLVAGTDVSWRWLRAGAEFEDYDSNFSKYRAWRIFETLNFRFDDMAGLGFNFNQTFYDYAQGGSESQYSFTSHLDTQLTSWLSWNIEGGYYFQDIDTSDRNVAAARTGFTMAWGKLQIRAGYQYNYQLVEQPQSRERRDRNFFYFHLKRVF